MKVTNIEHVSTKKIGYQVGLKFLQKKKQYTQVHTYTHNSTHISSVFGHVITRANTFI